MFAAVALLLLMIVTVTMFEVTVNNRPRPPKPPLADITRLEEPAQGAPDVPKP
ncbi:MAG: hypothetical protein JWQ95_6829 [Sphaerisporangium sp.]|jgi:hypothetical protein|nr:hypothetical protein [Sphaerisporangium sp.]